MPYKKRRPERTSFQVNESYEGETIEQKVDRIMNNKEPITDGVDVIYTNREDGVKPDYDIRTDRWEHAVDAMDKVSKTHMAKREERIKKREDNKKPKEADGGPVSTQGTEAPTS